MQLRFRSIDRGLKQEDSHQAAWLVTIFVVCDILFLLISFIAKICDDSKLFSQLLGVAILNNCLVPNNFHLN